MRSRKTRRAFALSLSIGRRTSSRIIPTMRSVPGLLYGFRAELALIAQIKQELGGTTFLFLRTGGWGRPFEARLRSIFTTLI